MPIVTTPARRPVMPNILAMSNAWPLVMWSITVPSLILETRRVFFDIQATPAATSIEWGR
jgi:hypothetical protein